MMADFCRVGAGCPGGGPDAAARIRSMSARVRPAPNAPTLRKLRRLTPSQNPCRSPQMVNMAYPPSDSAPTHTLKMLTPIGIRRNSEIGKTATVDLSLRERVRPCARLHLHLNGRARLVFHEYEPMVVV